MGPGPCAQRAKRALGVRKLCLRSCGCTAGSPDPVAASGRHGLSEETEQAGDSIIRRLETYFPSLHPGQTIPLPAFVITPEKTDKSTQPAIRLALKAYCENKPPFVTEIASERMSPAPTGAMPVPDPRTLRQHPHTTSLKRELPPARPRSHSAYLPPLRSRIRCDAPTFR